MSYDRNAAMDAWADQEDERRMDEYYDQQLDEHYECMRQLDEHYECMRQLDEEMEREEYLRDLAEDEAAKPKYQKNEDYYAYEAALDEQAEADYKEQLKKYYDELELQEMVESEEKQLECVINEYYNQTHPDELVVEKRCFSDQTHRDEKK
jgi:hypothetical protein